MLLRTLKSLVCSSPRAALFQMLHGRCVPLTVQRVCPIALTPCSPTINMIWRFCNAMVLPHSAPTELQQ